ncbi:Uncharacterised protein [Actinobacillus pleuropneumoniae]|nr:Uncharacterised protein [Actinobacillus pleuropneumoniae]
MLPLPICNGRIPAESRILLPQLLAGAPVNGVQGRVIVHTAEPAVISLEEQDILVGFKQEGEVQITLISPIGFGCYGLAQRQDVQTIGKLVIIARIVTPFEGSRRRDHPLAGRQLSVWGERHGIMGILLFISPGLPEYHRFIGARFLIPRCLPRLRFAEQLFHVRRRGPFLKKKLRQVAHHIRRYFRIATEKRFRHRLLGCRVLPLYPHHRRAVDPVIFLPLGRSDHNAVPVLPLGYGDEGRSRLGYRPFHRASGSQVYAAAAAQLKRERGNIVHFGSFLGNIPCREPQVSTGIGLD